MFVLRIEDSALRKDYTRRNFLLTSHVSVHWHRFACCRCCFN